MVSQICREEGGRSRTSTNPVSILLFRSELFCTAIKIKAQGGLSRRNGGVDRLCSVI